MAGGIGPPGLTQPFAPDVAIDKNQYGYAKNDSWWLPQSEDLFQGHNATPWREQYGKIGAEVDASADPNPGALASGKKNMTAAYQAALGALGAQYKGIQPNVGAAMAPAFGRMNAGAAKSSKEFAMQKLLRQLGIASDVTTQEAQNKAYHDSGEIGSYDIRNQVANADKERDDQNNSSIFGTLLKFVPVVGDLLSESTKKKK
jgi:hypothetical protein